MAARLNRHHQEEIRQKIQASNIINRLQKAFDGEVELTSAQVSIAVALLDRSVAKLQQIQLSGDEESPLTVEIVRFAGPVGLK